jgi:transcriptional regulator with XRE-family HTH domain
MKPMEYLRVRLSMLRKRKDLTQAQLAEQVGCSPAAISHLENGNYSNVPIDTLVNLARVLNCPTDYLLGMTNRHPRWL